jgi:hypothetical protein
MTGQELKSDNPFFYIMSSKIERGCSTLLNIINNFSRGLTVTDREQLSGIKSNNHRIGDHRIRSRIDCGSKTRI